MNCHTSKIAFCLLISWSFVSNVKAAGSEASSRSLQKKRIDSSLKSVPGEFLVKMRNPISRSQSLGFQLGGEILREIKEHNIVVLKRPVVELATHALSVLSANRNVILAEPNYLYSIEKTPTDKDWDFLWGLRNIGQTDTKQNGKVGVDVGAEKAWDITTGNQTMVVAVIDTGISLSHSDLRQNIWTNELELNGAVGVDDDGNGFVDDTYGMNFSDAANPTTDTNDDNGHGSHCAGTIGARGDQDGVVGINWNIKLMPVKFLGGAGGGTLEGAIRSIDYATKMGAHILSNSWGGSSSSRLLQEAIERAEKAGVLFVAAAGNDGMDNDIAPHYPSSYPVNNIVSVAAIDNRGEVAGFSNTGKKSVHIAAPGVNIWSTYKDGGYERLSGTSMATPHVSGVAALLWGHEPQLRYAELKDRLLRTVQKIPELRSKVSSGGIVNAVNALKDFEPGSDMNDPYYWNKIDLNIGNTEHPYKPNTKESFEVEVSGAKEISVYFERFETERVYDKVSFYDRSGRLLFEMMGSKDETFSPPIPGNYVRLEFTTDTSVEKFGFVSTKAAYR